MKPSSLALPLFLIIAGTLWLLKSMELFPSTASIIAFALMATAVLLLCFDGLNKQSLVQAPCLAYLGASIYAVYHYGYGTSPLLAGGMILCGCLMLLARSDIIPHKTSKQTD